MLEIALCHLEPEHVYDQFINCLVKILLFFVAAILVLRVFMYNVLTDLFNKVLYGKITGQ